jgi:hypothetical protein
MLLAAAPGVVEGIKWSAPSFRLADDFATFHLRSTEEVALILHTGAKKKVLTVPMDLNDPEGLIERLAPDRCMVRLGAGKTLRRLPRRPALRQRQHPPRAPHEQVPQGLCRAQPLHDGPRLRVRAGLGLPRPAHRAQGHDDLRTRASSPSSSRWRTTQRKMAVRRECKKYAEKYHKLAHGADAALLTLADYEHPYLTLQPQYEGGDARSARGLVASRGSSTAPSSRCTGRSPTRRRWPRPNSSTTTARTLSVYVDFEAADAAKVYDAFGLERERMTTREGHASRVKRGTNRLGSGVASKSPSPARVRSPAPLAS